MIFLFETGVGTCTHADCIRSLPRECMRCLYIVSISIPLPPSFRYILDMCPKYLEGFFPGVYPDEAYAQNKIVSLNLAVWQHKGYLCCWAKC